MYKQKQRIARNYYEITDLPYFHIQQYILNATITNQRMMYLRNLTNKYWQTIQKIYAYWLQLPTMKTNTQTAIPKIILIKQPQILSLDSLVYLYNDLLKQNKISKQQWNFVGKLEQFKANGNKYIEQISMAQYQIKINLKNDKNLFGVYYCHSDGEFRVKGCIRLSEFQIGSSFSKGKIHLNQLVIKNEAVVEILRNRYLTQKIKLFNSYGFTREQITQFNQKYVKFYEKHTKFMDDQILQLQVYHNFPTLRQKSFVPISFIDHHDGLPLVGPIFSNANPHCMFGHFTGYNSNTCMTLSTSGIFCEICHTQIQQFKKNFLLEYLRDNVHNPYKNNIQYIPQFNRFRIIIRRDQQQQQQKIGKGLSKLQFTQSTSDNQKQMQEQSSSIINQKMLDQFTSLSKPTLEIMYTNYMHLRSFLEKTYTKNRIKIHPKVQVQKINYLFVMDKNNSCFGYQLCDPVRGKNCQHYQFADLRMYYANLSYRSNGFVSEPIFICPICKIQLKDTELIYLKEIIPAIKYLKKQMFPPHQQEQYILQEKSKIQADCRTAKIMINHYMKSIFVEFYYEEAGERHHFLKEIQGLYASLIDPYIHFSDYGLGIRNKKTFLSMFSLDNEQDTSINQEFEKAWYSNKFEKLVS